MKVVVVSDSHGDREILVELAKLYGKKVDALIHCGDSELKADDDLWQVFTTVQGNCDYNGTFPKEQVLSFDQERVFITHGHLYNVGLSLNGLQAQAKKAQATVALYGHTHQLYTSYQEGMICLNPGSIRLPRGQHMQKTYVLLESDEEQYSIQFYDYTHEPLTELSVRYQKK